MYNCKLPHNRSLILGQVVDWFYDKKMKSAEIENMANVSFGYPKQPGTLANTGLQQYFLKMGKICFFLWF